ncbi:hypothetical protein R3P38DRAFT_2791176 [Favolaschia claudopus]|uniref:Uncharacterized protein n=1 Tax=Favolaschia claudopus TaxID=2862362 RepID=A0AAW0AGH8_9AGAR
MSESSPSSLFPELDNNSKTQFRCLATPPQPLLLLQSPAHFVTHLFGIFVLSVFTRFGHAIYRRVGRNKLNARRISLGSSIHKFYGFNDFVQLQFRLVRASLVCPIPSSLQANAFNSTNTSNLEQGLTSAPTRGSPSKFSVCFMFPRRNYTDADTVPLSTKFSYTSNLTPKLYQFRLRANLCRFNLIRARAPMRLKATVQILTVEADLNLHSKVLFRFRYLMDSLDLRIVWVKEGIKSEITEFERKNWNGLRTDSEFRCRGEKNEKKKRKRSSAG